MNDQKMHLDIVLRTHSTHSLINSPRIVSEDLSEIKLRCISSLFQSAKQAIQHGLNINIRVLDDHSTEEFLTAISALAKKFDLEVDLENLLGVGFNNSAYQQFLEASRVSGLVYVVEDDYFHSDDAILEMYSAYHYFKNFIPFNEVAIFPYDCPDRYDLNREPNKPCRLFYGNGRYWKTVTSTTNTIFCNSEVIRNYFPIYEKLALEYPKVNESNTINTLYNDLISHAGPVTVFSPIPSLAIHMSYEEPITLTTKLNNWKVDWENYGVSNDN